MIHKQSERLEELVLVGLAARGSEPAVTGDGVSLTAAETVHLVGERARALSASGARPGDAVIVAISNRPEDVVNQLAAWRVGAVAVPVYRPHPVSVLEEVADQTGARLLMGDPSAPWPDLLAGGVGPGVSALMPLNAPTAPARPAELDAGQALVIFTSGSTGRPKGVVISHRAFSRKLAAIDSVLDFRPGATMLQVLHLHFSFGQWTSLLTLASGGVLHLVERFATKDVLARLGSYTYDRIAVVPTMMRMLSACLAERHSQQLLDDLRRRRSPRLWIAGGEPLAAGLGTHFRTLLPDSAVTDVFGLSESCTSDFIVRPDEYDARAGSIGYPSPGVEAKVVARGVEVAPGETGELWLRTRYLMTGYLADPEATAATLDGEWLKTGDLALRRPDGSFELAGRAKNLIVRGGSKISPLEVENVFSSHPACSGVVAAGVTDEILGERIHLVVTPRAGRVVNPEEVRVWGRTRLEHFKLPDVVHVVDELPLGPTGKTDRMAVGRLAAELSGATGDEGAR